MSTRRAPQKLTDDDVRQILLAPADVSQEALAARFKVSQNSIYMVRGRRSWRAIKIAQALGLIPPLDERHCWAPKSSDQITVRRRHPKPLA